MGHLTKSLLQIKEVNHLVIDEVACQASPAFRNRLSQLGKTYNLLT